MRELVIVVIAALLAYLLWLTIRWLRLSSRVRKARAAALSEIREPVIGNPPSTILSDEPSPPRSLAKAGDEYETEIPHDIGEDVPALYGKPRPPAEPDASAFGFDALLEVRQTRHMTDALSREVESLKQEVHQLKQALADLSAAARVSPQYGEAVSLARRGHDAAAIAERCGISVSEAELVRSLIAMSPSGD